MQKGIIVLGMHRSGTSLVAELVHRWGAFVGHPDELLAADEQNIQGYWEYEDLVHFNNELLVSLEANWFIPPHNETHIAQLLQHEGYRRKAEHLVETMEEHPIWLWKDPRLSLLLPFWQQIWDDVAYIIVLRHPIDTVHSVQKRDAHRPVSQSEFFSTEYFLLLWQYYNLAVLRHTNTVQTKLFIQYEHILENPDQACATLATFLESVCATKTTQHDQMVQAVTHKLQHNKSSKPFEDYAEPTDEQKALYAFLQAKIAHPALPFHEQHFTASALWQAYIKGLQEALKQYYALASQAFS